MKIPRLAKGIDRDGGYESVEQFVYNLYGTSPGLQGVDSARVNMFGKAYLLIFVLGF